MSILSDRFGNMRHSDLSSSPVSVQAQQSRLPVGALSSTVEILSNAFEYSKVVSHIIKKLLDQAGAHHSQCGCRPDEAASPYVVPLLASFQDAVL